MGSDCISSWSLLIFLLCSIMVRLCVLSELGLVGGTFKSTSRLYVHLKLKFNFGTMLLVCVFSAALIPAAMSAILSSLVFALALESLVYIIILYFPKKTPNPEPMHHIQTIQSEQLSSELSCSISKSKWISETIYIPYFFTKYFCIPNCLCCGTFLQMYKTFNFVMRSPVEMEK